MRKVTIAFIVSMLISCGAAAGDDDEVLAMAAMLDARDARGVCQYQSSRLVGEVTATAAAGIGSAVAAIGAGLQLAGFYTLTHATAGVTMLASTAAGASAAGTVGIIGGTGAGIGAAAGILMAPAVIGAGALAAVGIVVLEGSCLVASSL